MTRFAKGVLYMHSFKTHFLSPLVNYINGLIAHDWLMRLAINLAALCDIWKWKWNQWKSFGCFYWRHSLCLPLHGSLPTPTLPLYRSASGSGICYASKYLSNIADNLTSYPVYSRHNELPWIAIDLWRNMCMHSNHSWVILNLIFQNCIYKYL